MEPAFLDGDLVVVDTSHPVVVRHHDVVVARHPFKNIDVVKYVGSVDHDGYVSLRSPTGDDSRQFGRVATSTIKGRVVINLTGKVRRR